MDEEKQLIDEDKHSSSQYLTFTLDQETFALDIAQVREVLHLTSVTKVPQTPSFMKGVINLRGNVVPVVDMRLKLGVPVSEKSVDTCIIIMEITVDGEPTLLGAIADSVQEVLELESDQILPPPSIGTRLNTDFLRGMGKHREDFILVLDIDRVFSTEDLTVLTGETQTAVNA